MGRRICTDIGGTFTDVLVIDDERGVGVFKSFTTKNDPAQGLLFGLEQAAGAHGVTLPAFLADCGYFGHGSTVATNAVLEGKTAKVGLICTRGFRDILLFREGAPRENPFKWDLAQPEPFVPRRLTLPVTERINAEGGIEVPLDEADVRTAVAALRRQGVQAIAVALLWSIANPVHELRVGELIRTVWPEVDISLSHRVLPALGEYRRTVCTAIDAALKPLIATYISGLGERLRGAGYGGELSLLSAAGGVLGSAEMRECPIYSLDSGPAQAPVAGSFYANLELSGASVITCDMGGTSFDVSRVTDGAIVTTEDSRLGPERLGIPKVDTKSIGAGGGSIAWVDSGGLLRVGPEGAGADPGPACYLRGGTQPTVTDVNLLLGYLDPTYFLGGRMSLSTAAAETAIRRHVADPLGLGASEAAAAVWQTVLANMTEAIRDITVYEGFDPREYPVICGGGAGGIHIGAIARELGIRKVVIPRTAAALSAFGGAVADVVREFQQSHYTASLSFDYTGVNRVLAALVAKARTFLVAADVPTDRHLLECSVIARYPFQDRGIPVSLRTTAFQDESDLAALVDDFHVTHERTLGARESGRQIECLRWRVRAIGRRPELNLPSSECAAGAAAAVALKGRRPAYFHAIGGMVTTAIFDGSRLAPGSRVTGPAIIEEPTTTVVVYPGMSAAISRHGNYILEIDA